MSDPEEEPEVRNCEASTNISVSRETLNEILRRPLTPGTPLRRTSKMSDLSFRLDSEMSVTKKVAAWNNNNPVVQMAEVVENDNDSYSEYSNSSGGSNVTVKAAPTTAASAPAAAAAKPAATAGDVTLPPLRPPEPSPGIDPETDEKIVAVHQSSGDPLKSLLESAGDGKKSGKGKKSKGKGKKKKSKSRSKSTKHKSSNRRDTNTTIDSSAYNMDVDVTASYEDTSGSSSQEKSSGDSHRHKKDGEVTLSKGMGAICFKVPGKITHKTTIKIAHYPQPGCELKNPEPPQQYDCEELVIHENAGTAKCSPPPACAPGTCSPNPCAPSPCCPNPCAPMCPPPCPLPCDPSCFPMSTGTYANNCNYYTLSDSAKQQQQIHQQRQYQAYQQQQYAQAMCNPYYANNPYCYRR